jgi:hypothetical protein
MMFHDILVPLDSEIDIVLHWLSHEHAPSSVRHRPPDSGQVGAKRWLAVALAEPDVAAWVK